MSVGEDKNAGCVWGGPKVAAKFQILAVEHEISYATVGAEEMSRINVIVESVRDA